MHVKYEETEGYRKKTACHFIHFFQKSSKSFGPKVNV